MLVLPSSGNSIARELKSTASKSSVPVGQGAGGTVISERLSALISAEPERTIKVLALLPLVVLRATSTTLRSIFIFLVKGVLPTLIDSSTTSPSSNT